MSKVRHRSARADLEELAPAKHIDALLRMAAVDDLHGLILIEHLFWYYLEVCCENGIKPLSEQVFLTYLARKVDKKRIRVDGRQRTFYKIPRRRK